MKEVQTHSRIHRSGPLAVVYLIETKTLQLLILIVIEATALLQLLVIRLVLTSTGHKYDGKRFKYEQQWRRDTNAYFTIE